MKTGDRYGGRMKIYKPLKYKLMKKIILSLTLLLVGSISYSQSFSNVDVGKHKEYMMKTYKLDSKKALSVIRQEESIRYQFLHRNVLSDDRTGGIFPHQRKRLWDVRTRMKKGDN